MSALSLIRAGADAPAVSRDGVALSDGIASVQRVPSVSVVDRSRLGAELAESLVESALVAPHEYIEDSIALDAER